MGRGNNNPNIGEYRKDYWKDRVKPKLDMVTGWARNGLSNEQIATNLGIGASTFYDFLKNHEELQDALVLGREDAEIVAENALFKKVTGYDYVEVTKERRKVLDDDGDWTGEYEMVTTKKVLKHVQPSEKAAAYWLEHRAPKRWERAPMPGLDTAMINEQIQSIAELMRNPVPERKIGSEQE